MTINFVKTIQNLAPEMMVFINHNNNKLVNISQEDQIQAFQAWYLALAKRTGVYGINTNHRLLNPRYIREVQRQGLSVWTWTVDNEERLKVLSALVSIPLRRTGLNECSN